MTHHTHRRAYGLLLGAATGLAYSLISQFINSWVMPGIPFHISPFGSWGNLIMGVLLGTALGLASAWPESGFGGVVWSSLLGSLSIIVATLLTGRNDAEILSAKIVTVTILFFPTAAVLSPLLILFRWITNREEIFYLEQQRAQARLRLQERASWTRVGLPVALLLITAAVGSLSLYNDLARAVMPRMQALIEEGRQATSFESLPKPLQHKDVDEFLEKGQGAYTLEWDKDDENRFAIPRPATSQFDQSTVIARFDNGYWLVCMFPNQEGRPRCKDF